MEEHDRLNGPGFQGEFFPQAFRAHQTGNRRDARIFYAAELRQSPDHAAALNNLTEIEISNGNYPMAVALAKKAISINEHVGRHWSMLGSALSMMHRNEEAIEAYRRSIDLEPTHPKAHHNLAVTLYDENRLDEAMSSFEMALAIAPDDMDLRSDYGMCLMAQGRLIEGLEWFEARWSKLTRQPVWRLGIPEWNGEPLAGKTIILHHEQGYGDTLQFVRFAGTLKTMARAERVIVAVPAPLIRLVRTVPGVDEVVEYDTLWIAELRKQRLGERAHYHTPMTSTLRHLGITYEWMAKDPVGQALARGYLGAELSEREVDRPPGTKLAIGIVWAGQPGYRQDLDRSMPFEHVLDLFTMRGVQLYSLQKGERAADLKNFGADGLIIDLSGRLGDWYDTARVMMGLDLVISVDTAPMHCAAGLGIPTIGLMAQPRCWRWLRDREDSPWYSSLRIAQQERRGDWTELMVRVRGMIEEMIEAKAEREAA